MLRHRPRQHFTLHIFTKPLCLPGSSVTGDQDSWLSLHTCMDFHVWLTLRQQGQDVVHAGSVYNTQKEHFCCVGPAQQKVENWEETFIQSDGWSYRQ